MPPTGMINVAQSEDAPRAQGRPAGRGGPLERADWVPEDIIWREIRDGGVERERSGHHWAPAPAWRGQASVWVLPADARDLERVVVARRRHRCLQAGGPGRYVDVGERYTDVASRHAVATARAMVAPTSIPVDPLDDWLFAALSGEGG